MDKAKKKIYFLNVLAFIVLMQNMGTKSPDYIMEKFRRYILSDRPDEFQWGLDGPNSRKLVDYIFRWFGKLLSENGETKDLLKIKEISDWDIEI